MQNVLELILTRSDAGGTGSIDPDAGHFTIGFGPFTSPFGGPPGRDHLLTGLAALDGESFTAIENFCLFEPGLAIRCEAPDGSVRIVLWRRAENPDVIRFHLAVWNPPIEPKFVQPLIISVHAVDGGRRGILFGCRPRDGGGTSCSQPGAALRQARSRRASAD